ncbi:hypothetical protein Tco_1030149 [Tanacetum coccineum]|uniref:Uncharacterized protein n=1 Tax=Tanacetum coccineum TaxID=301880 RepID=A0ABQ5G6M1_9ASTR
MGLAISTHKLLDSRGFITLMTPTQALKSLQVMTDHSYNWYDEVIPKERINDRTNNVDAIRESFKGAHLTKEYPLKRRTKQSRKANDEWIRKSLENTESNIRALKTATKDLQEKAYQLTQTVLTNTGEKFNARMTMGKGTMKEPVPRDLPPTPFQGHLKEQMGSPYRTRKTVCMIENPGEVHKIKAQDDEGDMDVGWDITFKDVERLRQFLTPTINTLPNLKPVVQPYMLLGPVHDKEKIVREEEQDYDTLLHDGVIQPLTPQTVHITPPDDDYVAPTTSPTLDKQLNKLGKECSDITRVTEKANSNPIEDVQELSDIKIYDCETFIWKLLHQVPAAKRLHRNPYTYGVNPSMVTP